jgi:hypothetical protein
MAAEAAEAFTISVGFCADLRHLPNLRIAVRTYGEAWPLYRDDKDPSLRWD